MSSPSKASRRVLATVRGAMIAALYCALTYLSFLFGLSGGAVQFRVSEALCVLPAFMPEAIPGLFLGCLLSNLFTGALPFDILFGSLATLLGALGAWLLRRVPAKLAFLIPLPTVIANVIVIPPVLLFVYGAEGAYPLLLLGVFLGEAGSALVLGTILYFSLLKTKVFSKR